MINQISNLNRFYKQIIVLFFDILLCFLSLYIAYYLRIESFIEFDQKILRFFIISFITFIPVFIIFGLYNSIFRYSGVTTYFRVVYAILIYSLLFFIILNFIKIENIPRSSVIIQAPLFIIFIVFFRLLITFIFKRKSISNLYKIAILGESNELFDYIPFLENHFNIEFVFDINNNNLGKKYKEYKIHNADNLLKLLKKNEIYKLFIINSKITDSEKEKFLNEFYNSDIILKFLPSLNEFISNPSIVYFLKKINFEDIIKSKILFNVNDKLLPVFKNKNLLITGAGGSIGSQLCREVIKYNINTLILLDHSEYNLYIIREYLIKNSKNCKIVSILGSINEYKFIYSNLFDKKIDYVFHSAAYKHVPLLEENCIEAVKNNIVGTYNVAKFCSEFSIPNILLISTDKAVKPTNIMGATKRIAENIFQAFGDKFTNLNYNIVRFGNVVNSKGSVLPMFSHQIENRLPIQLTHMDVERYFMTIPDATKLIIEISSKKTIKNNTGIYFLDMGKSLKIFDLINLMLKMNGLKFKKNKYDSSGDILLDIIGLRPGEKISEELSINQNYKKTDFNNQIYICEENFMNLDIIEEKISTLKELIIKNEEQKIILFLETNVEDFKASV